jgi:hypothetical protein
MEREHHGPDPDLDSGKAAPSTEAFLIECLAWGLLRAYDVTEPPVPIREMIKHPIPVFERLSLLEMNLGLYKAAYRSCLDGSRLIVVDPTVPSDVQRESMARELYVAFCLSPRAAEMRWPFHEQSHVYGNYFARCLLMPAAWVQQTCTEAISMEGLAARFGVSIQTMNHRLTEVVYPYPRYGLGESLARLVFSLDEPWQGRFLDVVANMIANQSKAKRPPTQKEMASWLDASPSLYQDVRYMLDAWRKPWNVHLTTSLAQSLTAC